MKDKKMTAEEFSAFEPMLSNLNEDRILAAKLRLVDGIPYYKIAELMDCSKQAVHSTSTLVWKRYKKFLDIADNVKVATGQREK
ncbi:MAG: hypothetical protein HOO93_16770 [Methyloglobulus sp.]|uniref:hypothetical protein n=1 Tax=Methyloglobulus sp. TaxID=2518622 RepID=UPI0018069E5E|nr:hypothetical protein [Methyloglobulus sp.]